MRNNAANYCGVSEEGRARSGKVTNENEVFVSAVCVSGRECVQLSGTSYGRY